MTIRTHLIIIYLLICSLLLTLTYFLFEISIDSEFETKLEQSLYEPGSPVSLRMYYLIEKYSEEYNIPKYIAYNISYKETTYRGPFDWSYKPGLVSYAGAVGPMQVIPSTASFINNRKIDKEPLRTDLDLNIMTSMKYLRYLKDKYKSWDVVCGYYNTGRPIVNDYARYCSSNKNYTSKWVKY
jgi:soluble lytic murein transglycosylase-like protein